MCECFLTILQTAVPYLRNGATPRKLIKSQEKLCSTCPIKPPTMEKSISPRIRLCYHARCSCKKKPQLDDLTLRYLEDPYGDISNDIDDIKHIRELLQKLLDYFLSEYQYNECTYIKKCVTKIDTDIFVLENNDELTEHVIDLFLSFWEKLYINYLEFCKNENSRLELHQKKELAAFDEAFSVSENDISGQYVKPPRPMSLSLKFSSHPLIIPDRITDLKKLRDKKAVSENNQQMRIAKAKRERLIEFQKTKINSFVEFSKEVRSHLIFIKKEVVNKYIDDLNLLAT